MVTNPERNEINKNETKRNQRNENEIKTKPTKPTKAKRNQRKQNEIENRRKNNRDLKARFDIYVFICITITGSVPLLVD
jgi:hypothetical protein